MDANVILRFDGFLVEVQLQLGNVRRRILRVLVRPCVASSKVSSTPSTQLEAISPPDRARTAASSPRNDLVKKAHHDAYCGSAASRPHGRARRAAGARGAGPPTRRA